MLSFPKMTKLQGRRAQILGLAVILVLAAAVYLPGLNGPFVFDDFENIVNNPAVAMTHLSWSALGAATHGDHSGYLPRWLPMISFALDHYIAGNFDNTLPFKLTNLLIHLINTILVYAIARHLVRRLPTGDNGWLAPMVTAVWALHPIQVTAVLYVVQRMASMSALFVLGGFLLYLAGRERLARQPRQALAMMLGGLGGGVLLGISCKENAVLLPLLALSTELTLYRDYAPGTRQRRTMQLLFAAVVGIPLLIGLIWLALHPHFIASSYTNRDFNMVERALTETRVLWYYLGLLVAPIPTHFGIYHDDFPLSTGLIHPATTLIAILAWLAAGIAAWRLRTRVPELGFALLWYLSAQALESSIIGLELVHEHRNYVASFGPLLMGLSLLARLPLRGRAVAWRRGLVVVFALSAGVATLGRAEIWHSDDTLVPALVAHHPRSARSQSIMGEYLLHRRRDPISALVHFSLAARLQPLHAETPLEIVRIAMQTQIDTSRLQVKPQIPSSLHGIVHAAPMHGKAWHYHLQADQTLLSEIDGRLRLAKVSPETSYQLARLTDCATLAARDCASIVPTLRHWYRIAVGNPKTRGIARAWLSLGLARLELRTGRPLQALAELHDARLLRTRSPEYWLILGQASAKAGRPDRALAAVQELRKPGWTLNAEQKARFEALARTTAPHQ